MAPKGVKRRRRPSEPQGSSWRQYDESDPSDPGDGGAGARQREAAASLLRMLLRLYAAAKLSAKDFCVLAHYAAAAGVPSSIAVYGLPPGQATDGNYQRHLDARLPTALGPVSYTHLTLPTKA